MAGRRRVLDDQHPRWVLHSGREGHRGYPEWRDSDIALARAFYASVDGKAKVFLDLLIDHPGEVIAADDMRELGAGAFTNRASLAGSISRMSAAQQASGRRYPFYWWNDRPTRYGMKPFVAALFTRARGDQIGA